MLFVSDTIANDNSQMVLQKEPCSKCVVAKADELLLGMDIVEQGGDEGKVMVYRTSMGQVNHGEGGEVLTMDFQRLDA